MFPIAISTVSTISTTTTTTTASAPDPASGERAPGATSRERAPGAGSREGATGAASRERAPGEETRETAPGGASREGAQGVASRESCCCGEVPERWGGGKTLVRGLALLGLLATIVPWIAMEREELAVMRSPGFVVPCVFVTFSLLFCSLPAAINFLYRRELQFEALIDRKQPTQRQKVWLLRIHRLCMLGSGGLLAAGLVWYRVYCYPTSTLDTIERASVMATMVLAWLAYQSHLSTLLKYLFASCITCGRKQTAISAVALSARAATSMRKSHSIPSISAMSSTLEMQRFVVGLHRDKLASDALDAFAADESIV